MYILYYVQLCGVHLKSIQSLHGEIFFMIFQSIIVTVYHLRHPA